MMKHALRQFPSHLLLVLAGSLGSLSCFVSAFGLTVGYGKLIVAVAVLAVVYTLLFSLTKLNRFLTGSLAAATATAFFLFNKEEIGTQALCALYRVLHIGAQALGRGKPTEPPELIENWASADTTVFLLFVMLLFVAALSWAVAAHRSFTLSFLLTMLFLAGPFFLTITPEWRALMMVIAFWTVMLITHVARHAFNTGADFMGLALLPLAVLMIFMVGRAIPEEDYTRPQELNDLRVELTRWSDINLNAKIFTGFGVGALGKADFSNTGDWHTNGALMLRVADENMRANYMRGNTGAVYTGSGWEPIADSAYRGLGEADGGELMFLYGLSASTTNRVTLQYIYADKRVLYTPYYLVKGAGLEGLTYELDRGIRKDSGKDELTLTLMHALDVATAQSDSESMQSYGAFVREHYLQTPESLRETLAPIIEENRIPRANGADYDAVIRGVAQYLRDTAIYTLSPGELPRGKDFVEYFLLENKAGYCIHFASAGVMLLRMQGVPARYADGYVVREVNFNSSGVADIPDRQAHAWVEVFYDGIGWVPVELTPGASIDIDMAGMDSIFDGQEEEPEESLLGQTPDALPEAVTPPPSIPESNETAQSEGADIGSADELATEPKPSFWLILCPVLLMAAGAGLRAYYIRRRKQSFMNTDLNARVVAMYIYIEKLQGKRCDIRPDITALAQKAQFSRHKLTEAEAAHMRAYVEEYRLHAHKLANAFERVWLFSIGL